MPFKNIANHVPAIMLGLTTVAVLVFFLPYATALIAGAFVAIAMQPAYLWIHRNMLVPPTVAALFTVFFSIIIVLIPLGFLGALFYRELAGLYRELVHNGELSPQFYSLLHGINDLVPGLDLAADDVKKVLSAGIRFVIGDPKEVIGVITSAALGTLLTVMSIFYFLKDGKRIKEYALDMAGDSHDFFVSLFARVQISLNSVLRGTITVRFAQGAAAALGYALFGVSAPISLGFATMIAAYLPVPGTSLIWLPTAAFLLANGRPFAAAGIVAWGLIVVSIVDNALAPKLMQKGTEAHPLPLLFSIAGGIHFFGLLGIVFGPVLLSVWVATFKSYRQLKD